MKTKHLKVNPHPVEDVPDPLKNALIVFKQAIAAANEFYKIYQKFRKGSKGTTGHAEQDLLRAMLVFACSGLDAVVKQLIADALEPVVNRDIGAQKEFQKFVERRLKKGIVADEKERSASTPITSLDTTLLASILVQENPRSQLIELLKIGLSDDSLQSKDQLLRVAAHFAITRDQVMTNEEETKKGFDTRNEIIHEMDVDLSGRKKRRQRKRDQMVTLSENMLSIASRFIMAVKGKLI